MTSVEEGRRLFGAGREAMAAVVARFAEPREVPLRLLASVEAGQGHPFGEDLGTYVRLYETYDLDAADPATAELRAPGVKVGLRDLVEDEGPSLIADALGFLTASSVIVQQDEMSFLASWAATPSGTSRVFYFHPSDWGLWATDGSITARLFRTLQDEDRPEHEAQRFLGEEAALRWSALEAFEQAQLTEPLPPHLDPAKLYPRADWLIHALLGAGRDFAIELPRAAPLEAFAAEAELAAAWPHLATYWLWSHFLFDNREALETLLERSAASVSPVVHQSRQLIADLRRGKRVRLGGRDNAGFEALRRELWERAPREVFGADARRRAHERRATEADDDRAEKKALVELEAAAEVEPLVQEALLLLEHLKRGGTLAPGPAPVHGGLEVDAACDRLAELMDPRFRPLILARLVRAARQSDTHQDAGHGLILAWGALARSVEEFEAVLERLGKEQLGPRRLRELYRAYGRFEGPRATRVLAEGAATWLREVDDWIRMAPVEPVLQLLRRDTLETHQLIAALLERAQFSPASFDVCVAAAQAAGELGVQRAVPGLRRAVERHLGRVDDGGRAAVVRALWLVDGAASAPFLRGLFERRVAVWEEAEEEDAEQAQKDVACYLTGLLPMCPDELRVIGAARALLELFRVKLGPKRTPRRDVLGAATAILMGIGAGEVRALAKDAARYAQLRFGETASTRAAAAELRRLAAQIASDLGG